MQSTSHLLMVRPAVFRSNEETAVNNFYQRPIPGLSPARVLEKVREEFDALVRVLSEAGVDVVVIPGTEDPDAPDAVFPNNWISFHEDGRVGIYPMFAESRRLERRDDVIDLLASEHGFRIEEVCDLSGLAREGRYLEGTGSLVLDRVGKVAYAAIGPRTHPSAVEEFCRIFGYTAVTFTATEERGGQRLPIYHTNVMMSVCDEFALVCFEAIADEGEARDVRDSLHEGGRRVIPISQDQVRHFVGNALQVRGSQGEPYLVMSSSALANVTSEQRTVIESHVSVLHSPLDVIQLGGGGSARCMIAEIFLPSR